jgi:hypothetical protein
MPYKIAVVSHGKDEDFFYEMWLRYYGELFGYENLYFVKDSSDWVLPERSPCPNVVEERFPAHRQEFDQEIGRYMSVFCSGLLDRYDIVIRTDIDEFLFPDPKAGSWDTVFAEVLECGYLYALGFDVIHRPKLEGPYNKTIGIFEQRLLLRLDGTYCKSHIISQPVQWRGPCHRIEGVPFRISNALCMAHLALIDRDMLIRRLEKRGDMDRASRRSHAQSRINKIDRFSDLSPYVSYDLFHSLRDGVSEMTKQKGDARVLMPWVCKGYGRNIPKGFLIERPDHFAGLF